MELSDELYALFRDLLLTRAGLHYPERKRDDLAYGLSHAAKTTGHTDLGSLYLDVSRGGPVWETVLEQLTIGETYFFRNAAQFEALQQQVLPELFRRQASLHSLRIWSAGCATGEEPYSLAMTLKGMPDYDDSWQISILATDINSSFLARAREALYGSWSFRETPAEVRDRFFTAEGSRWRLAPEIRRRVTFARLNLVEDMIPSVINGTCALDIIFCRNVMIYFDEMTIRRVVDRFYRALSPGGWLFVGHAEPQVSVYYQFEVHNFPHTVVYRKPLDAPLFAFDPTRGVFDAGTQPILDPKIRRLGHPVPAPASPSTSPSTSPPTSLPRRESVPVAPVPPPIVSPRHLPVQPAPVPRQPYTLPAAPVAPPHLWSNITTRLAQGDTARAELLLAELLAATPNHVEALTLLGRLYADRGEWSRAQQQCEQALAHNPLATAAHFLLAQIYEHQGQLDAALAAYRRTVYLDRNFIAGVLGMANVWRQLGRTNDALRCYRNALNQLTPLDPQTPIPGTNGVTASELVAMVKYQMRLITS